MIPLAVPDLSGNESRYLEECVTSNFISSVGSFVGRFEEMVANVSGSFRGVATSSGTAGLHAALVAVGVERDDLVILPSLTFIASANAISYCGADPWLFDVERTSWNLDPEQLARRLESDTEIRGGEVIHRPTGRRVAAIMPVYTLGLPADMDRIVAIAREYNLPVVADSAAALGAVDNQRPVGALGADLTVFSFNGNKTLTCGGGGAVVGDDPAQMDLVKHLTTTARYGSGYDHDRVGFNYRLSNVHAAIGTAQLERIADLVAAKQRIRRVYDEAFDDISSLIAFPDYSPPSKIQQSSCWFSGVFVDRADPERISSILAHLKNSGIESRPFWKPIHLQDPYKNAPKNSLTVCDDIWFRVVVLPCSVGLSKDDQEQVINAVLHAVSN
ncbi:MAG: aminotransferase class I/II-fold pyridoxal phosphate-dependent enzyme [Magnetococcales bacterium]|nr:aminotransferase class I/II-fold pyridoxal phosphate-dependent enzyme [Magnetococcales bacterium]